MFSVGGNNIPPVKIGGFMTYVGHKFSFSANAENAKTDLLNNIHEAIDISYKLPITLLLKCHALNLQLRAKLSFILSHYAISCTWIKNNLDTLVTERVRKWLDLPPCSTAHYIPLPTKDLGLDLVLPSLLSEQCLTSSNLTLAKSKDPKMKLLYKLKNLGDQDAASTISKKDIMKGVKQMQISNQTTMLNSLHIQSLLFGVLVSVLPIRELEGWCKHLLDMTPSIANFARRALIRCLATQSNLLRWGRATTDMCPNCKMLETENHVLNNCSFAASQGRYTWRHNAVLRHIVSIIKAKLLPGSVLYVDLPGYNSPGDLFIRFRPDLAVVNENSVSVLELTCCYEQNLVKSRDYKKAKYSELNVTCDLNAVVNLFTLEVSSLGFLNNLDFGKFCKNAAISNISQQSLRQLGEICLRCSYFIFCCRHKPWPTNITDPIV